jgi:cellulose synthase/poly-beta-1,6-N-acetylglucosamine synthase-like glycosyltransferase
MTAFLIGSGYVAAGTFTIILIYLYMGMFKNRSRRNSKQLRVSVIVAAHNEEKVLTTCLDALMNQNYPQQLLEIIIVDDRSTDATLKIIQQFEANYEMFKYIHVDSCPDGVSPKKYALSKGIEKAKGEIILTTDADCIPPESWVKKVIEQFSNDISVVIGYAPLITDNSFISKLTALDAVSNAMVAHGSSGWNFPLTCTGRNFAYRKSLFIKTGGFDKIEHILTGDDDLLLMHMSNLPDFKVKFLPDPECKIPSNAPNEIKHFISQRKRHLSGAQYFPLRLQIWFGIFYFSRLTLAASITGILISDTVVLSAIFIIPYGLHVILLLREAWNMGQVKLLMWYPIWEIFYLLNQLVLTPLSFITKKEWGPRIAH